MLDLAISAIDEEGYGVATWGARKLRVSGAFPGEAARVLITHIGKQTLTGRCLELLKPSPLLRTTQPSGLCKVCDNCQLALLEYASQLEIKRDMVSRCLSAYRSLADIPVSSVIPSPNPLHYRTAAKLIIGGTFRSPKIGIYRRHSHDVVDIEGCPLHHPLINTIIAAVKEGITRGKIQVYSPTTGSGLLRYLVIRVSDDGEQAMVIFVTAFRSFNEIHHLSRHVQTAVPKVTVMVQNENASSGNAILGDKFHFLTKQHALISQIGKVRLAVSPRSFLQVNSGSAGIIYDQVAAWGELTGKERVIDLYCGIGGIALFLAAGAGEIIGIEVVEEAVQDADKNARMNGIDNCSFASGDAGELLAEIREEWENADLIVLNPPRKGCDKKVLNEAAKLKPVRIIYVSCSPWSLARDLDILSRLGYRTIKVQPVDMFPQTSHIENVALLTRE
ncbi:putative RNA methyltransferase [Geobacter sp. OR-1]|nr:putative RNA methyltransferase [Geobacter sp. OR-1]